MSYSSKNPKISTTILTDQTTSSVSAAPSSSHRLINRSGNLWLVDSSGVERPVGGASSGINYLADWFNGSKAIGTVATVAANGNITVAGSKPLTNSAWYADATSGAAAIALSSSTALRFSSNYLTALSGSSASGATFVQTAAFTVDDSDLGKPVSISFDLTGVTTADDWDIVVARYTVSGTTGTYAELIPVAGTASSITGTPGAQLPTGTTQFRGFFVAGTTSTDVYALRFRRRTGTTQIRIDSLTVGPQSLAQGAVVTAWQSYTPTFEGFGTATSVSAVWRRNGDTIEVSGNFTAGIPNTTIATISLPSGLNLDSTKINGSNQFSILGSLFRATSTTTAIPASGRGPYAIIDSKTTSTLKVYISSEANSGSGNAFNANTGQGIVATGDVVTFQFRAPISQWSSGTTTLADRAVEEYASNSNATTSLNTSDTTSFAYGPSGSLIPNATNGANTIRRVRFQTPILPTDKIAIEYLDLSTGSAWQDAAAQFPQTAAGTGRYGATFSNVNSNDIDVYFLGSGYFQTNTIYGGAGATWASLYTNNTRWRVRKVSGGAAVGFPVSARNVVGDTTTPPAGYIGEKIDFTSRAVTTASAAYRANTTALATLNPGIYLIFGYASLPGGTGNNSVSAIATNSNNDSTGFVQSNYTTSNYQTSAAGGVVPQIIGYLSVSSGTTQALYAKAYGDGNTPIVTIGGFAVRIA